MILKDLGARENYRNAMINKVKPYSEMTMTPTKINMVKRKVDLEYKEVMDNVFKVVGNKMNKEKVREAQLDWTYIKDYHFDAGWFERIKGLEGAVKLI